MHCLGIEEKQQYFKSVNITPTQYFCTLFDRKSEVTEDFSQESLISLKLII